MAAWLDWAASTDVDLASKLGHLMPRSMPGPNVLVLEPEPGYNWVVDACERPELRTKIESALRSWLERPVELRFARREEAHVPQPHRNYSPIAKDRRAG